MPGRIASSDGYPRGAVMSFGTKGRPNGILIPMTFAAMLLSLAAWTQETDVERLVRQLQDEDPDRRAAAEERLVTIGETTRDALQAAAKGSDLDVAAQARRILRRIEI